MKKLSLIFLMLILLTATVAKANSTEKYLFESRPDLLNYDQENSTLVEDHFLGEEVAVRMFVFKNAYTFRPEPSPMDPSPPLDIEKYGIYNSVKKLNSFFKKGVRKGQITQENAIKRLSKAIDIAVQIRHQKTDEFEQVLREAKSLEQIEAVFSLVELQ